MLDESLPCNEKSKIDTLSRTDGFLLRRIPACESCLHAKPNREAYTGFECKIERHSTCGPRFDAEHYIPHPGYQGFKK